MALAVRAPEPELEPHQRSMLQACTHGRLDELRELFEAHDVHTGDATIYPHKVAVNGPPDTISMFVAAIDNNQFAILEYLLSIYQGVNLEHAGIAYAIIKAKDPDVLQRVIQQSPQICSLEFYTTSTFLTELCREGPCASQLVNLLLDHGADADGGGHTQFSCLGIAMANGLPVDILRKMLNLGAIYKVTMITYAIQLERVDALQLLLDRWRGKLEASQEKRLHEALETCTRKQIIDLTNQFINKNTASRGNKIQSIVAHFCERLARTKVPYSSQCRKIENEKAPSKEILPKAIDEEESD